MIRRIITLLFLILSYHFVTAQNSITVDIQDESYLTLVGSTNIAPFLLIQKGNKIQNKRITISITRNKGRISFGQNQISLKVLDFSSDNPVAYHDFMHLLKVKHFPELSIQLLSLTMQPNSHKVVSNTKGNAFIAITITGVTKQYLIPFSSSRNGDIVTLDGDHKLSIRDFGLIPPTKLMGLVKTSEMVNVNFHFIFKMNNHDFI